MTCCRFPIPVIIAVRPLAELPRGAVRINPRRRTVSRNGCVLALGRVTFRIAEALLVNQGRGISVDEIIAHAYCDRADGGPDTARWCLYSALSVLRLRLVPLGMVITSRGKPARLDIIDGVIDQRVAA